MLIHQLPEVRIYSFAKYLLNAHDVPASLLGTEDSMKNKTDMVFTLVEPTVYLQKP